MTSDHLRRMSRRQFFRSAGSAAAALATSSRRSAGSRPSRSSGRYGRTASVDWQKLATRLSGPLVLPTSPDYPVEKQLYNERFDSIDPAAIAYCRSVSDVQRCLEFCRESDVRLAARSGGHSYGGYSLCDGLVVDVTAMAVVSVDPSSSRASVGAGARLIDIYSSLGGSGFLLPGGSCPTVGIAGLALGGGMGVLGRNYGLTCDNVESMRIVTADGDALEIGPDRHEDLYWACRGGGGGNFGVVTSFVFSVHPIPEISLFTLDWPWSSAAQVLGSWQEWIMTTPDALWANCQLSSAGSNGLGVRVTGVFCGPTSALDGTLQSLLDAVGSRPTYYFAGEEDYMEAMLIEAGCENLSVAQCHLPSQNSEGILERSAFAAKSAFLKSTLSGAGLSAALEAVEALQHRLPTVGGGFVFDSCGGAIGRPAQGATAFAHRDAIASIQYSFSWSEGVPSSFVSTGMSWLETTQLSLSPYVTGAYVNYIDPDLADWESAYYGSNLERLRTVKRKYDPDDFFHFAQSIPLPTRREQRSTASAIRPTT